MADYIKVGELLASQGILNTPAELHGLICGQLCAGAHAANTVAMKELLVLPGLPDILVQLADRLFQEVRDTLNSDGELVEPLLPDDEEELGIRLEAVARWCDGFNMGFASHGHGASSLPEETGEVLRDFARIAELDASAVGSGQDSDEADYMEIVEYVRIAATSVYMQSGLPPQDVGSGVDTH